MSDENNLKRALIVNKGITELKEKIMKISEVMASFLDAETLVEGRLSEMESKNSDLWNVLKSYKKEIAELKENCKRMAVLNIDRDNKINRLLAKLDGEDRQPKTYKDLPQEEKERRWKEFNKRVREGYPEFDSLTYVPFLPNSSRKGIHKTKCLMSRPDPFFSKVNIQWLLYCMIHNIEKIVNYGVNYGFT